MVIHKIIPFLDYNYWLKCFNTQFNEPTNYVKLKSPKLLRQQMRKRYYKTLGISEINSPMFPSSLWKGPIVIINKINLHYICIDQPMMFLLQHKQSPHRSLSPQGDYKPHLKYCRYFQKNKIILPKLIILIFEMKVFVFTILIFVDLYFRPSSRDFPL